MGNNTLGDTIRYLRKKQKLTQEELAEGICSAVSISRIENGVQMPSSTVLGAILGKLGTSAYQLCNIYYQTDRQMAFEWEAEAVEKLLQSGQYQQAMDKLKMLEPQKDESRENLQCFLMLKAAALLQQTKDTENVLTLLENALALSKESFDYSDFRNTLLTVREANILNLRLVALERLGRTIDAIRMGEELVSSLKRHCSALGEYMVMRINASINLSQCLLDEGRFQEALECCEDAEEQSIGSTEQILLPEIEYVRARTLHMLGRDEESRQILKAVIPYMDLVKKADSAEIARAFAKNELNLQL